MTDSDLPILRLSKFNALFIALLSTGCASAQEHDQAAKNAARICNVSERTIMLTSNSGVDQRSYWLVAQRGALTQEQFDCVDKWSLKSLHRHADLSSSLPARLQSKAEVERQADILSNQMAEKRVLPNP